MARTEFTPLIDKLNEAAELFADLFENLLQKAENEKTELKSLYARMKETSEDISMMADIGEEVGNIFFNVGDTAGHVSDSIKDAITGGESKVPDCSYEEFMRFCDECGSSIKVEDAVYLSSDNEQWLCEKCHDAAAAYTEDCERAFYNPNTISRTAEYVPHTATCECAQCQAEPTNLMAVEISSEN